MLNPPATTPVTAVRRDEDPAGDEEPLPIVGSGPVLRTPTETAAQLHVTVGTLAVWRCTRRHPLAYHKIGRSILYDQADIDAFLAANKVSPSTPEAQ